MTIIVIFGILILSVSALVLKKNRWVAFLLLLNISIFTSIGSGFLPELLLKGLQVHRFLAQPQFKEKNLILLLTGGIVKWADTDHFGTHPLAVSRANEAARLYFLCKKSAPSCTILVSGGDPAGLNVSEAAVMRAELITLGIAQEHIETETKSLNTIQNAKLTAELIKPTNYDNIFLVTSGTHMGRALLLFPSFGIEATPAPSDQLNIGTHWKSYYSNFYLTDLALHEYAGQLKFLVSK